MVYPLIHLPRICPLYGYIYRIETTVKEISCRTLSALLTILKLTVDIMEMQEEGIVPFEGAYPASYDSDASEIDAIDENNDKEGEEDTHADLGGGWGRIIFNPVRRGKQVGIDVCRSTNPDGSEGSFERVVITQRENPTLHHQAKRSLWGDLWPF